MDGPGALSTDAFVEQTGVTYRIADYWARTGVLRPSIAEARGSGTARRYSAKDVEIGKVIARLGRLGAGGVVLTEVAAQLRYQSWGADGYLVVTAEGLVAWCDNPSQAFDQLDAAWVVRLAADAEQADTLVPA